MMPWRIELFDSAKHRRASFDCGQPSLNKFIQEFASQYDRRSIGRTYVLTEESSDEVHGFYTISASSIPFQQVPATVSKRIPHHPLPAMLLGRLAVDQRFHGQGLGNILLKDAFTRIQNLAMQCGIFCIEVDAIDDAAVQFYQRYGFVQLVDQPHRLILTLSTLNKAQLS